MRGMVAIALALSPTLLLYVLLAFPEINRVLNVPVQHVVLTTNVSVVALLAGMLVARGALQAKRFGTLMVAIGFICMAGIFTVHALTTPNVLMLDPAADLITAVSAQLALLVPAVIFTLRYTRLRPLLELHVGARPLLAFVLFGLTTYAVLAFNWPSVFAGTARLILAPGGSYTYDPSGYGYGAASDPGPLPYIAVGGTVALYMFSAWSAFQEARATRLPLALALSFAFALLAQAQISQFLGPIWSLSWWEYHALMLAAVSLAVGAIFLELDRRRGLERFLPSGVVDRVLQGDATLKGERRTVTILFADLRGSTELADEADPVRAVGVVNEYVRAFASAVLGNRGIIDKFTGDGLMAIFGVGQDLAIGARDAAAAALSMSDRVARLTAERGGRGEPTLGYGIGIHLGEVVLGAVGLPERSDYTALGDTVNTASRMESLTKELDADIVLSADVARALGPKAVRRLGEAQVRGKSAAVEVFTLTAAP